MEKISKQVFKRSS